MLNDRSADHRFDAPRTGAGGSLAAAPRLFATNLPVLVAALLLATFVACVAAVAALGLDLAARTIADATGRVAIRVVLSPAAPPTAATELQGRLEALPAVHAVRLVGRDDAWRAMQAAWPAGAGANPLPDVLLVSLQPAPPGASPSSEAESVRTVAVGSAGVESVRVDQDWLAALDRWRQTTLAWHLPVLAASLVVTLLSSGALWWIVGRAMRSGDAPAPGGAGACIAVVMQFAGWLLGTALGAWAVKSFASPALYIASPWWMRLDRDVTVTLAATAVASVVVAGVCGWSAVRNSDIQSGTAKFAGENY